MKKDAAAAPRSWPRWCGSEEGTRAGRQQGYRRSCDAATTFRHRWASGEDAKFDALRVRTNADLSPLDACFVQAIMEGERAFRTSKGRSPRARSSQTRETIRGHVSCSSSPGAKKS